jgi:hypothetical protein
MNAYRNDHDYQEPDEIMIPSEDGFIVIPTNAIRMQESSDQRPNTNNSGWRFNKLKNILQFTLMPVGMMAFLAYIGFSIAGMVGLFVMSTIAGLSFMAISNNRIEKQGAESVDRERE